MGQKKIAVIYIKIENDEDRVGQLEKCRTYIQRNNYIEYERIYEDNKYTLFTEYDKLISEVGTGNFDCIIISSVEILNNRRKNVIIQNSIPIELSDFVVNEEDRRRMYELFQRIEQESIERYESRKLDVA